MSASLIRLAAAATLITEAVSGTYAISTQLFMSSPSTAGTRPAIMNDRSFVGYIASRRGGRFGNLPQLAEDHAGVGPAEPERVGDRHPHLAPHRAVRGVVEVALIHISEPTRPY